MSGACLFLIYIFSIADRVELNFKLDLLLFEGVMWFWDLTCVFWAENGERKMSSMENDLDSCSCELWIRHLARAFSPLRVRGVVTWGVAPG